MSIVYETPTGNPVTEGLTAPSSISNTILSIGSPSHLIWLIEPELEIGWILGPGLTVNEPLTGGFPHKPPVVFIV